MCSPRIDAYPPGRKPRLASALRLQGHQVESVPLRGAEIQNGDLPKQAIAEGFEALVTILRGNKSHDTLSPVIKRAKIL